MGRRHGEPPYPRGIIVSVPVTDPLLRRPARERSYEELEAIFAGVDAPFALVDLDALWSNARELLGRAQGTPIRVASKSVRCRALLASILERDPGFRGLMTFTLAESLWLHEQGFGDLLLAYPTADRAGLARLARLEAGRRTDPDGGLGGAARLHRGGGRRAAQDRSGCASTSTWAGGRCAGAQGRRQALTRSEHRPRRRRWPVVIVARPLFELRALMGYEAHIAGLGDEPRGQAAARPLISFMKRRSAAEIAERQGGGGGSGPRGGRGLDRQRGWHGQHASTTARAGGHGDHAPARGSTPPPCSTATRLSAQPRRDVRDAGRATAERRGGHASGRRLSGIGRSGSRPPPAPHLPRGLRLDARRVRARCRRQ